MDTTAEVMGSTLRDTIDWSAKTMALAATTVSIVLCGWAAWPPRPVTSMRE